MTPEKQALIRAFIENKQLSEAVLDVLKQHITPEGIAAYIALLPRDLPDNEYAGRVKVRAEAAALLSEGFAQLTKIAATPSGVQLVQNEAR